MSYVYIMIWVSFLTSKHAPLQLPLPVKLIICFEIAHGGHSIAKGINKKPPVKISLVLIGWTAITGLKEHSLMDPDGWT